MSSESSELTKEITNDFQSTTQTQQLAQIIPISPLVGINPHNTKALENFNNYRAHLEGWYHSPDIEALEISMCAAAAHRLRRDKPIWLFVIGPSGSGKSSTVMPTLRAFDDTHEISDITPNTFLSGLGKASGGESLLLNIGSKDDRSAIFLFPDFTLLLSKDDRNLKAIAGQMREIHDGRTSKRCGARKPIFWQGKVTVIAMCTPKLERAWGRMREMGERFLQVRWGRGDGISQAGMAFRQLQSGNDTEIEKETEKLSAKILNDTPIILPDITINPLDVGVAHLSEMTAMMRAHVVREEYHGKREILDTDEAEGNTRLFKGMVQLARARAGLYRRPLIFEDYKVASRVAIDSMPATRLAILELVPQDGIPKHQLVEKSSKPKTTTLRALEELCAIGVLREEGEATTWVGFSEKFYDLRKRAEKLIEGRFNLEKSA